MYQSETCIGVISGKPLMAYESESEANEAIEHVRFEYQQEMIAYRCSKCGDWHLAPQNRQTPSRTCPYCIDSQGAPKQAYATKQGAVMRSNILLKERGIRLYAYECECGYGWHLTKTPQ